MKKSSHTTEEKDRGVGGAVAGAAALIVAAAGAYFLYGTDQGAKTRKQIKGWSLKAKGEVLEQLESLTEVSEVVYTDIVKNVIAEYQKMKRLDASDVADFVSEMAGYWKQLKK